MSIGDELNRMDKAQKHRGRRGGAITVYLSPEQTMQLVREADEAGMEMYEYAKIKLSTPTKEKPNATQPTPIRRVS